MAGPRLKVDVYLPPGELGVYSRPLFVKTILGSCVAVVLWDGRRRVGGLNHFVHPRPWRDTAGSLQHGSVSCRRLIETFLTAGSTPGRLWAALVGGGSPVGAPDQPTVGAENVAVALAALTEFGIPLARQETGGSVGRKLLLSTGDGKLIVRTLRGDSLRNAGTLRP